ncbi:MAG: hypothetical protein Q4G68_09450 [Planctomycetia bacterium]|nr:hypothetical protein [Planctomycetia bacterium]
MYTEEDLHSQLDQQYEQLSLRIDELDRMIEDALKEWGVSTHSEAKESGTTSRARNEHAIPLVK